MKKLKLLTERDIEKNQNRFELVNSRVSEQPSKNDFQKKGWVLNIGGTYKKQYKVNINNVDANSLKRQHFLLKTIYRLNQETKREALPNRYDQTFERLYDEFRNTYQNDQKYIKYDLELQNQRNQEVITKMLEAAQRTQQLDTKTFIQQMQKNTSSSSDSESDKEKLEKVRQLNPLKNRKNKHQKKLKSNDYNVIQKFPFMQWCKSHKMDRFQELTKEKTSSVNRYDPKKELNASAYMQKIYDLGQKNRAISLEDPNRRTSSIRFSRYGRGSKIIETQRSVNKPQDVIQRLKELEKELEENIY